MKMQLGKWIHSAKKAFTWLSQVHDWNIKDWSCVETISWWTGYMVNVSVKKRVLWIVFRNIWDMIYKDRLKEFELTILEKKGGFDWNVLDRALYWISRSEYIFFLKEV